MVSESAKEGNKGQAFGVHKALDLAGSAIGILLAYLLIKQGHTNIDFKRIFLISIIPAILGLLMFFFVKEKQEERPFVKREPFWENINKLDYQLKLYLLVAFLFTLGNSSNAFLLLRAKSLGFDDASVIFLYFIYNLSAALLAIPAGKRSDVIGRKKLLVTGYFVFSIVYLGFAFVQSKEMMIGLFILYGLYTALITGVERAFISEIAPTHLKGTMLGMHSTIVGVALLPASTIAGFLWNTIGAYFTFVFGSFMSLLAAITLLILMKDSIKI